MDNQLLSPRRRRRRASGSQLPEDLVLNILSRLPTKTVLKYQLVCRRWKALTSTKYFSRLHMMQNCSIPVILVDQEKTGGVMNNLFLIDPTRKRVRMHRVLVNSRYYMEFSCDGLMLLRGGTRDSPDCYVVLNPITGKKVEISTPVLQVEACGIFFHPLVEEHCILWRFWSQSAHFKMLILGSEPRWRELSTGSSVSNHTTSAHTSPVVVDDILYWLAFNQNIHLYEIIAFDMKREEISRMPDPDPKEYGCRNPSWSLVNRWNLMKNHGHLSLVQTTTNNWKKSLDIHIWILKDYANGSWIRTHTINTEVYIEGRIRIANFLPVGFVNEELILQQKDRRFSGYMHTTVYRLLACNIESGTRPRNLGKDYTGCILKNLAHVPILFSMKNWKSEILMPNQ